MKECMSKVVLYTYTAERRDVLGCTSSTTKRFPEAREMSRGPREISSVKINPCLIMMREWPYTASNRDALGCTSPPTSRFSSALKMSLGLCPRDISRASGNLLVVGDVQPNTSLLSAVFVYNVAKYCPILQRNCPILQGAA